LKQNQKQYHIGYFENEEHAAMNVNSLCDRLGIEHKNPTIDIKLDKIYQAQHPTSKYTGVSWSTRERKWLTQLMHNGKSYSGGKFDNEVHAAMKVNLLCDKYGIKRKNPNFIIEPDAIQQHFKSKTSIYIGVCWDNNAKKWQAKLHHNKRLNYGGFFDKEEDAAMKVNLFCDKCGIERKNPMIDIELIEDHQVRNSTSQFIGVYWDKDKIKWVTQLIHNGKKYSAGKFDNEKHAAMKVNLLCDKLGIKRKNLMIDIQLDTIRQKTKSNQSKAENLVNEKEVKVEEENILYGLKNRCENNFMKKSCPSQKRKRKED